MSKPPLKWVGGKTRLLPTIKKYLPANPSGYFEPFVGGGALFFDYGHTAECIWLNDINQPLINAYNWLSDGFDDVLELLTQTLASITYQEIKDRFNDILLNRPDLKCTDEFAALFIALNHLCFNGVWRENKKGQFNVPVGRDSKGRERTLATLKLDDLRRAGTMLQRADLTARPFDPWPFLEEPTAGDVVFYDSPYIKEFSQYNKDGFTVDMHKALAQQARLWQTKGATVVLCMSDNEAAREIYGQPTEIVGLSRTVGHSKRKKATEAIYVWSSEQ